MLEDIKKRVYEANLKLVRKGLSLFTWGNASEIDREKGFVVIKPSGVDLNTANPDDMVVVSLETGAVIEGKMKPSSDTPTHLVLYKEFSEIGGIVHTHSKNAVAFAQAGKDIPVLGTTHADYFCGSIPCTRDLTAEEVFTDYERNTGIVISEEIKKRGYGVMSIPGVIVKNHGPFSWGKNVAEAVFHSEIIEMVSEIDINTLLINNKAEIKDYVVKKHYYRKHGVNAYYGQTDSYTKK